MLLPPTLDAVDIKGGLAQDEYLHKALGTRLGDAEHALEALAASFSPEEIGKEAYRLYTEFRPAIPDGQPGWGRKGLFNLEALHDLYGT